VISGSNWSLKTWNS